MRGFLTATAVLGVLAIGGLPALALTLAADETAPAPSAQVDSTPGNGMPPWAQGKAHGRDKAGKDARKADRPADGDDGTPGWLKQSEVPPGWTKNHGGQRPHGWNMREWAHCVGDAVADRPEGEKPNAEGACGPRPTKPSKAPEKAPNPSAEKSSGMSSEKSTGKPAR